MKLLTLNRYKTGPVTGQKHSHARGMMATIGQNRRSGCDQRELPDTIRQPWPHHTSQGAPRAP